MAQEGAPWEGTAAATVRTRSGHISSGTFVPLSAKNSTVPEGTLHSHSPQRSLRGTWMSIHGSPCACQSVSQARNLPSAGLSLALTAGRGWTLTSHPAHIAIPNLWPRCIPHPVCKAVPASLVLD